MHNKAFLVNSEKYFNVLKNNFVCHVQHAAYVGTSEGVNSSPTFSTLFVSKVLQKFGTIIIHELD